MDKKAHKPVVPETVETSNEAAASAEHAVLPSRDGKIPPPAGSAWSFDHESVNEENHKQDDRF